MIFTEDTYLAPDNRSLLHEYLSNYLFIPVEDHQNVISNTKLNFGDGQAIITRTFLN